MKRNSSQVLDNIGKHFKLKCRRDLDRYTYLSEIVYVKYNV